MATITALAWVLLLLSVLGRSVSSSLPPASNLASPTFHAVVSTLVGKDTVLPCSWQQHLSHLPPVPHVQWCLESSGPVLEQRGSEHWASAELLDRARVSESGLQTGDCSLLIRDVQVSDGGQYHGYMILDEGQSGTETRTGTGVFIGSVKLLVFDHRSVETKHPGEDLVLNLFTPRSMSLFFQSSNSSEWEMLWTRDIPGPGMGPGSRVQMDSVKNRLLLRSVSQSDQGIYKVLDLDGLTVSSTRLSVDQHASTAQKFTFENYLRDDGVKITPSALLLAASLLFF
ncbi:hypothetical protein NQD34_008926 [Periophthalmus magnuspinnatus]|uniref:galectin 17 n=1 Tax=Periophthalmus magnuspinnatus TaxID=409849 RepID=UPI00145B455E|nr:galectin 17 [Periophthalmus magnuspinnatus]XP_033831736.1 galectin 17 [Periophthalmus magnuspinnatus]KAJ0003828.1 hypothetical protein NQD34_008926 [Periophthalmus magnuspinnatus]